MSRELLHRRLRSRQNLFNHIPTIDQFRLAMKTQVNLTLILQVFLPNDADDVISLQLRLLYFLRNGAIAEVGVNGKSWASRGRMH